MDNLINKLPISEKAKNYFNSLELYDILQSPILLSNGSNDVDEARDNCWSFKLDLESCDKEDIKTFFQALLNARRNYLLDHDVHVNLIFYVWYNSLSGNFYVSIIPENWSKLPFGKKLPFECTINNVGCLDEIIEEFANDP